MEDPVLREALRCRSLTVRRPLAERGARLPDRVVDFALAALPLLEFGWAAIDGRAA